jgi:hypothetical protein
LKSKILPRRNPPNRDSTLSDHALVLSGAVSLGSRLARTKTRGAVTKRARSYNVKPVAYLFIKDRDKTAV